MQYADFAVWQRAWLTGNELARQTLFWRAQLADAPPLLDLPLDRPRPRMQSYRGRRFSRGLSPALTLALKARANDERVTLFMLLFAAFNVLLARWSGQQDLVVGTPIAGRQRTELEGLIGFFANTLALRTRIDCQQDFSALLAQVRATTLAAFAHQDLPFEKLVELLQPPEPGLRAGRAGALRAPECPLGSHCLRAPHRNHRRSGTGGTTRFDVSVSASEFEERLWFWFEYNTDLLTRPRWRVWRRVLKFC